MKKDKTTNCKKVKSNKTIYGHARCSQLESYKEILETDKKAKDENMSYGEYVAKQYLEQQEKAFC